MSFLKSFRNSVSRKSSSSKNNTSLVTIGGSGGSFRRATVTKKISFKQDDEQPEGLIRSNTFTVKNDESVLVKVKSPSKTASMFGKFGTFGRKKKQSPQPKEPAVPHQPGSDPFGVLYSNTITTPTKVETVKKSSVECGTYRKNKLPSTIKEQLAEIKDIAEQSDDRDKFKTVTLNSFRKSFRDKFLNPTNDVPYNPAWFIEVESPKPDENDSNRDRSRDTYILDRDSNYRSESRSPAREIASRPTPKPRSSVKRNETFRVERESDQPSIRIEIKNSITPNQPSRIVPVGVAKPMLSSAITTIPQQQQQQQSIDRSSIIQRTWIEPSSGGGGRNSNRNMYRTTIQISDGATYPTPKPRNIENINSNFKRSYTPASQTKIQITNNGQLKDPFISNYTPLTSYGMIKTMNHQSIQPTTNMIGQRVKTGSSYRESSPSFEVKKWTTPTIPIKQKSLGDSSGRREATNITRIMSNARKPMSKAPWR